MLASWYIQVPKELPRYQIYRQKSRLRKVIEDIGRNKTASGGTDEIRR